MIRSLFFVVLITCYTCSNMQSWAQKYYNQQSNFLKANRVWAFGRNAGLDFNSGQPVSIQTGAQSLEGTASACDPSTGALLFYVARGGEQVWNRNHQLMPNGDTLGGSNSTSQTCIVPMIDSAGIYYVFALPMKGLSTAGLQYSIVDMRLDNGLGDVRPGKKRVQLLPGPLAEAIIAIPGNNCDIWLMTHRTDKPEFVAFHITENGIDPNPVLSAPVGPDTTYNYGLGGMYVSPNRELIYITAEKTALGSQKQCLLYKFDAGTGKVYDPLIMENPKKSGLLGGSFTAAFSPDNSKLYLTTVDVIRQYDISIYNPIAIDTSEYTFGKGYGGLTGDPFGLRLYGDTIYVGAGRGANARHISTISNPNLPKAACGYDSATILLMAGTFSDYGMCNEIVYPFMGANIRGLALDTLICSDIIDLELVAAPGYNYYYWQDGYPGAQRQVNSPGTYWVTGATLEGEDGPNQDCNTRVDTFIVRGGSFSAPVITVNVFELSTTLPYKTYQWYFNGDKIQGATQRKLKVNQNGNYTVEVSDSNGCKDISSIYKVTNVTGIDELNALSDIEIYPNPAQDFLYVNSTAFTQLQLCSLEGKIIRTAHSSPVFLADLAAGTYILHIKDKEGKSLKRIMVTKYN